MGQGKALTIGVEEEDGEGGEVEEGGGGEQEVNLLTEG